jgi:hypothetical protein
MLSISHCPAFLNPVWVIENRSRSIIAQSAAECNRPRAKIHAPNNRFSPKMRQNARRGIVKGKALSRAVENFVDERDNSFTLYRAAL